MKALGGVKGFHDIVPPESERFTALEDRLRGVLRSYNYDEIRVPIAERTELFARSLGETTDIVEKEMYTFDDRDGTSLTLRPEGTASVVRAAIAAGLAQRERVAKLYYTGPMFRRERPQRGRSRQFHQIGAELIGRDDAMADAETVVLFADCLTAAGVSTAHIVLNSLGDAACRPAYRAALTAYGEAHVAELCANCRQRLTRNPLRLLDCKEEGCRRVMADAPRVTDHLCDACRAHFDEVKRLLAAADIAFSEDPRLVRGLDYYVRTAFEALAPNLGAQNAVGGGGRYDGLVEALGGPPLAGVGFALGVERLLLAGEASTVDTSPQVSVIPLAAAATLAALQMARRLRLAGVRTELESSGRSVKSAMRRADKLGARFAILVGDDELAAGRATVRDLRAQRDHRLVLAIDAAGAALMDGLHAIAASAPPVGAGGAAGG
ncbi:MAG: histidine--tRNA ligase [Deltaproteobacteria bacterium]|nr:histidine--tRNA ligase [Deltaproteobacteria bacterium]